MKYEYKMSICMMVKDEEKNLRQCLETLSKLTLSGLAELIIIDTGSEDSTVSIAKEFTDKVYFHQWNNNFSDMRNISISYARGEWILIIDADERLDDVEALLTIIKSNKLDCFNTGLLNIKNIYNLSNENKYNLTTSPRLFKNDGEFRYQGTVHNQPIYKEPILRLNINLTHYGYISNDKELMDRKFERTSKLLMTELERDPNNLYYIFQLGVCYDMHDDSKSALSEFRRAYSILRKKNTKDKKTYIYVLAAYANSLYMNLSFEEAVKIAKETLNLDKEYLDMYYIAGFAEKYLGNMKEAISYFNSYINLINRYENLEISKNASIAMYYLDKNAISNVNLSMVEYYLNYRRYVDAYKLFNNIIDLKHRIICGINILIELKKYEEIYNLYSSIHEEQYNNIFLETLESKIENLQESEKAEIYKLFSKSIDSYGLLCKLRLSHKETDKFILAEEIINNIDLNKAPLFYLELLQEFSSSFDNIFTVIAKVDATNLKRIALYLIEENKTLVAMLEDYIINLDINALDLNKVNMIISFASILLLKNIQLNNSVNDKYTNIFNKYVELGLKYVSEIYQVEKAEVIYNNVGVKEDKFFLIMYLVNNNMENNEKKIALSYLRIALYTYEEFVKYIDLYKDKFFANLGNNGEERNELYNYKIQIKDTIRGLIHNDRIDEAKLIINEYEQIIPNDIEILLFKSQIALKEY